MTIEYEELNNIAEALTTLNYKFIAVNALITCIAIVGIYIYSRIKKSAELHEINLNFDNVLEQQKKITKETEIIKQKLDKESIGFQIKLHSYNEKSIDAINSIYIRIIELREAARDLGFNPSQDEIENFKNVVATFRREHDVKKIWLPKELSKHIGDVAMDIDKRSYKFIRANNLQNVQNMSDKTIQRSIDEQESYYDFIGNEIHNVFETLVDKISNEINANNA